MTIRATRHPDAATLMSYAAGTLPEALAAVVASHAAMCADCRAEIADLELMGEALLLSRPRHPLPAMAGSAVALAERRAPSRQSGARRLAPHDSLLPAPIVARYGLSAETVPWRLLGPGVWHARLALSSPAAGDFRLLKISPSRTMPEHGHGGTELTLVLDGAYADDSGRYTRGDLQDIGEDGEHQPVADARDGCICLIASERPARFKGLVGRLIQPLTGM